MKIKMKKITAGRGVLLAMALSLTFVLSTLYVVPVAGRTEVAVEASRTKSSRAEETNVPSFKIDGFVENETRASLSSSSSSSLEEKKKSASKRSKSSVANDSSAPMTKMPSSTTTVEPAVAGETDDLSEGFIRKGEIFAPANAAVFEGNDEIVALGKDDNDLVDDSSLEVLKVEDPLVEVRKSDFVEKFDMSKNVHYIEPLDENGPLPLDYVPPESKITEDEFRAEFDAKFNNMTEAEAMLGDQTSALATGNDGEDGTEVPNLGTSASSDASSDDEETIEALMTSIPSEDDDAGTSVETGMGEEGDGERDEVSEDSTALPISDEEKLVGNDLDDHDPALATGNDGEDGTEVPNLGTSASSDASSDDEETIEALMTSIPSEDDDAGTSVETGMGEEGDGERDEVSEDSTALPISDEEKLVGNDLDDHDPALATGNDGEDGTEVPNLGTSASSDASSDDEETIEALMTSIPSEDDDAGTSVETGMGEEGDGERDEVSEDSTALPISDEEKLVGNDLDDHDPALATGNDGEDGTEVPNLGTSASSDASSDDEETIEALMTSIPSEDDDAGTSVETGMGEEGDGERDEVSEDSTALPISDEEKLVGNDLDDHDPALATGNDGEDGTEVPNLGSLTQKRRVLDHNEYLTPPSSVESPNAVAHHAGSFAIKREEFSPKIYFDQKDRAEFLTQLPPDNTFKELSSDESLSATNAERILKSSALLDEYYLSTNGSDRIPGQVPVSLNSVDYEISFDVDVDYHGNIDADLGIGFDQNDAVSDLQGDSTFDEVEGRYTSTIAVNSMGERESNGIAHLNIDADDFLGTRPTTRVSEVASMGAPFENHAVKGTNFNSVGNPKFLGTQNGWNAYGGSYGRPSFSVSDSICILNGLIKGSKWGHLATLPSECRPRERIIFNVNNHQYTTRVDVLPDGGVYWVAGGSSHSWLSLTGIKFVTNKGPKTQVSFLSGAKNYGGVWEDAYYSKINSECVLGGLIKKGSSWEVAQLPSTCRPEKALIFNVNNHQCTMRLNIYTDGKITASTGGCHAWVSLSGVSFIPKDSKSSSRALASSLKSSWVPYGGGTYWEAPSYTLVDGECLLQGLIQKGSWGHIATLPAECRPYKRLIFNLNNHQYTSRVDVLPDGRVYWVAGGRSHGWLSLTGISFVAVPRYAVTLSDQWQPYGYDYGTPTWKVQDQLCEVAGLIYGSKWGHLATLPSECRPRERIIFNVNNHQYTTRVDVLPDGGVYWVAGGKSHGWLSLTGIKFVTNKGPKTQVSFLSGAKNYGGVWEDAYYSKINSECVLGGLIKKGSSWEVAQLPSTCRPEKALIFNVNNHQCTMRLNIYTDGKITASTGGCHAWVSLSGVSFIPKDSKSSSRALASSLKSSWVPYGGGTYWEAPSYTLVDGECLLQGLIQKGSWGHIATLPAGCRPYKRLIFNLNNHQYTSRVDVLPDGRVYWVAGGRSHGWLSLTGIRFEVDPPAPPSVSIGNPWKELSFDEFDFDIRVSHDVCSTSSCFGDTVQTDANVASGLKCEVFVRPKINSSEKQKCTYDEAGTHLPCKNWDNFFDTSKSPPDTRTSLSLTNKDGNSATGEYEIWYNCFYLKKSKDSSTGWKKLHTFRVIDECSDLLPSGFKGLSIVEMLLHSSPSFLELSPPSCESVDIVKESIFREYDLTPQDGRLDENEVREALSQHDVDTSSLKYIIPESTYFRKKGGIMLSDFITSSTLPLACSGLSLTKASDIYFTEASYTNMDSDEAECKKYHKGVHLKWDHKRIPQKNDRQCLYTDGRLLRSFKTDDKGQFVNSFKDERPSSGVGPDAVNLQVHISFDSNKVENIIGNPKVSKSPEEKDAYVTSTSCVTENNDGGKCFNRISASSSLELSNERQMSKSSVMAWIKPAKIAGNQYLWQSIGFESKFQKAFGIRGSGKLFVQLNDNVSVEGDEALQVNTWYHVAMTLNKANGIGLYINGELNKSIKDVDNTQMDFPHSPMKVRILDAIALYDDLRIYTGIVTKLHISSIYSCGRRQSCAKLAHATPQSRRVYCIVPKYNKQKSSEGFVPPCAVGLFYNGAVIDLQLKPSQKGVLFSFRDTALHEISYEILRRPSNTELGALGDYKTVVMIDSALDFCATTFSSLTFFDDESIKMPGDIWEYAIKTKFKESTQISDPRMYTSPFYAMFEGAIVAGKSGVAVPNIRACTRIVKNSQQKSPLYNMDEDESNLSAYMYAWHSEQTDSSKRSSAFKVTDQDVSSYSKLEPDEWFNVSLASFSLISKVNVCTKQVEVQFDVRVLDYQDPNDKGDMGSMCILAVDEAVGTPLLFKAGGSMCRSYLCRGTRVSAYFGQSVSVKSTSSEASISVSDIQVMGVRIDCPYTSFSDEEGNFEIDVLDLSGEAPRKAFVGVSAFKTDIFDEIDTLMVNATSQRTPEAFLIALAVDETRFRQNWKINKSALTDAEAACYLSKYKDLQTKFGKDLNEARKHYAEKGSWEGRSFADCSKFSSQSDLGQSKLTRVPKVGVGFETDWKFGESFNSVGNPKFLGTQNGWNAYGGSYGRPSFSVSDSICILDGLIKGSKWGHLATLPSECRPRERIIFNVNNHQYTTRVDVLPDGGVYWVAGGKSHGWLSLTGIKFVTNKGPKTQVSFLSGAKNYGGVWEDAYYSKINSECVLGGLIKKGSSWEVAQLPSTCRPEKALIFNVNNHQCTMRLNIYTDGKITASTGGCHAWVSLSGVSFIPKDSKSSSRALASSLKSSWVPYGGGTYWEAPSYTLVDGECLLQGLIQKGSWGHIATLPAECRPYKRLIFNLNNHQYTSRVDVLPDGRVYWVAGGKSHGWLSLTGISFVAVPRYAVTLSDQWQPYGYDYGTPTWKVQDQLCEVAGLIYGSKWGHLATLPSECRPRERIIFNVNNHQYTTRVDVLPDGGVYWVAGGKSHGWLSLTGIKFVTNKGPKTQVSFLSGAKNYGGVWEDAYYSKINSECVLGGLIKKGSSWEVAQLPSTCRPEKALIFNVNNHQCTMRLNIYTDGKITASTGGCHAWVSLSGVSFIPKDSKSSSRALASSLKSSWVPYGGGTYWEAPSYTLVDGECLLQGLIQKGSWGHIATLPAECRPYKRLIFNLNNHQYTSRVDVLPDGRVYWVAGGKSHGWLSLTGIRFEFETNWKFGESFNSVGNPKFLGTQNGWNAYGGSYGRPSFSVSDSICILDGLIKGSKWGHLATLPSECRPRERIIFNVNNHQYTTRVDVLPDGGVYWVAGGKSHGWLSLTGIKFVTNKGPKTQVSFLSGAKNYGGVWEDAYYSKINSECVLGGLIKKGSSWEVAQLPSTCRPEKALIFNVNNHQCTMRLNIYTDGKITASTGGCHAWVSLSGVSFIPKDSKSSSRALASSLKSSWVPYGGGTYWEAPSYTLVDGECLLQGLIQKGSWGHIATLPAECRPYKRLIFNLNNHQYTSRVDVLPDGRVYWVAGGKSHGWLSLTGISFVAVPRYAVTLSDQWQPYGYDYGTPTWKVQDQLCEVAGLIYGSKWGHLATLPSECRPRERIIFNVNNHQYTTRVDVLPDGGVYWVAGGKSHGWLSLTGIKFVTNKGPKTQVSFLSGAKNYGGVWEDAYYSKINSECVLGGLIKKGSSWEVAQLPSTCRPEKALIFNVNNHQCTMRLNIYTDGKITASTGGCHAWVSLSGVSFIPKDSKSSSRALASSLKSSWVPYGGGTYWEAPSYTLVDGECLLQGLIQKGSWGHIATLPAECRPYKRLIFNLNNHQYTSRVDVLPDGRVYWVAGGKSHGWLSLTGIRFEIPFFEPSFSPPPQSPSSPPPSPPPPPPSPPPSPPPPPPISAATTAPISTPHLHLHRRMILSIKTTIKL